MCNIFHCELFTVASISTTKFHKQFQFCFLNLFNFRSEALPVRSTLHNQHFMKGSLHSGLLLFQAGLCKKSKNHLILWEIFNMNWNKVKVAYFVQPTFNFASVQV